MGKRHFGLEINSHLLPIKEDSALIIMKENVSDRLALGSISAKNVMKNMENMNVKNDQKTYPCHTPFYQNLGIESNFSNTSEFCNFYQTSLAYTPVNPDKLAILLKDYKLSCQIVNNFKHGYTLHYTGPLTKIKDANTCVNTTFNRFWIYF